MKKTIDVKHLLSVMLHENSREKYRKILESDLDGIGEEKNYYLMIDYLDTYMTEYSCAVYKLIGSEEVKQFVIPLINIINTFIELFLKFLIITGDDGCLTLKEYKADHHQLDVLVDHELIIGLLLETEQITQDEFKILRSAVIYFHNFKSLSKNTSLSTRYPFKTDEQKPSVDITSFDSVNIDEIKRQWENIAQIHLNYFERGLDYKTAVINSLLTLVLGRKIK